MKKILTFLIAFAISSLTFGQLTGVKTIPGDYASLTLAIADLNTSGVGAGGVTFNVAAGYTETFASPTAGLITATGTATDLVIFQKIGVGANPLITAGVGTSTTVDGIIVIAGGDYITFDGIDLQENALNTTSTQQMEWGYALLKKSNTAPFDGCQYVTIKNCIVSLNKTNLASVGIYAGNHISTSTATLTITATTDAMNNCKFFGNTISNTYGGIYLGGFAASTPFTLYDQNNEIGVTAGNIISNLGAGANSVRAINAIYQNGLKVANNIISSSAIGAVTTVYGIFTSTGTSSNVDIYNNIITLTLTSGTYTSTIYGINNAMGSTAASNTVNIYNNIIQNCDLSASTTGAFNGIVNSATAATVNIYGNTVNGTTLAGTGSFIGIYNSASMGTNPLNIYSNIISNNIKTGASGSMYCTQAATASVNFYLNNIHDNAAAGTSTFYGYYNISSPVTETYHDNTIYNLTHNGTGTLNAFQVSTASGVKNIYSNTIHGLTSGGSVAGYSSAYGAPANIYKNKIYNLTTTGTSSQAMGISFSGTTGNVYNNYVSDLKATASTNINSVIGINLSGGTTQNAYYNTVYLNATSSSATTFGTSGIYASTTPTVDLRNNIVVNTSTPVGATGFTSAYRRSGTSLTTYAATSNNNDFYAGAPGTNNVIFYDGTNSDQTLAAYKTRVSTRDAASITENPTWVSITGSDPTYLHISTTIPTSLESGGANIATITDDYDGDVRNATTPDIGADEFTGIPAVNCAGTPASSTISGLAVVCSGTGTSLSLSTLYYDLGMAYQWGYSTVTGGPYTNMGTSSTQATGNISATTYYVCTITCTNSGLFYTTAEHAIGINALPSVAVTPTSATYCTPGGAAVSLTANGANTYVWSPAAGLSATTGANVTSSPSNTTTYTVSGTDLNGCINTASTVITVGYVVSATATATPSTICSGDNSQLLATGTQAFNTPAPSAYNFAGSTGTYTVITGTTLTVSSTDDNGVGNLPIGFPFNYNGTNHTIFGMRTNGLIELDQATAALSGYYTNALASNANCIAPLWDDNNMVGGTMIYATTGSVGSRVLTAQWTAMHVGGTGSTTNPTIDMQIKLYEGTNVIEFVYGSTSAALAGTTASIGISGAVGNYISVTPLSPANTSTVSSTAENTTINAATNFPTGTIYTFTPTGASTFTYAWSPASFITGQETLVNPLATAVTSTTAYTVTVTGAAGCSATANTAVTISAGAAITTQPVSISKCTGETATFTVAASGAGLTYQWRKNGVDIPIGNNASAGTATLSLTNVTSADDGTYDVTVTSTCGSPVTSDGLATLIVKPVPTASASSNSPVCSGSALNLTGTTDIGTSYDWTGPAGFTSNSQNPTIATPALTAAGTYSFTATLNGCSSTIVTTAVIVNAVPQGVTALASQSTIACGAFIDLTSMPFSGDSILLSEDFNGATNSWTTTNTSTGTTPADADWTLKPDGYTYVSNSITFHSNDNTQFYLSNSDTLGSGSTTATTLESPAFSTVGMTNCSLNFFHYYRHYTGGSGKVEVYNGTVWTSVVTFTSTQGGSATFVDTTISLNDYLGLPVVKIRFNYSASWGYYWAVDNVVISANNPIVTYAWTSTPAGFTSTDQNPINVAPTVTTDYTVAVTNPAGCISTASATVTVNSITAPVLGNDTSLCGANNILLDAGLGYDTYLWSTGAATQTITLDTTGIGLGTFHIWVRGSIGSCTATDTIHVTFTTCVGLTETNGDFSINIFPNPTNGIANVVVKGLNSIADLTIYTLHGQLIFQEKVTGNSTTQLDLTNVPSGIYMVRISNETINNLSKLVIQ